MGTLKAFAFSVLLLASGVASAQFTAGMNSAQIKAAVASELNAGKSADAIAAAAYQAGVTIKDLVDGLIAAKVDGAVAVAAAVKAGYSKAAVVDAAVAAGVSRQLAENTANSTVAVTAVTARGTTATGTPSKTGSGSGGGGNPSGR
jgi:hypothetical protein